MAVIHNRRWEALHNLRRLVLPLLVFGIVNGCMMATAPAPKPVAPIARSIPPATRPTHPLLADQSGFLRLGNTPRGQTTVRIGVLLPFSNGSLTTRALAASLL